MKAVAKRIIRALWLGYLILFQPARFHDLAGIFRGPDYHAVHTRHIFIERARFFLYSGAAHGHRERKTAILSYDDISRAVRELQAVNSSVAKYFTHRVKHGLRVLADLPLLSQKERKEIHHLYTLADLLLRREWAAVLDWHTSYPWKHEELGEK